MNNQNTIKKVIYMRLIYFFILFMLPIAVEAEEGLWLIKNPSTFERSEVAVASLNEKIYVIGGFMGFWVTDLVEEYDPSTDTWRKRAPLPQPLHHAAAAAVGGKIYVIGGFKRLWPWKPVNTVYEYNPTKDIWSEKSSMPTPRGALSAGVIDERIYVIGGVGEGGDLAALEVYDPLRNVWEVKKPMLTARDHLAIGVARWKALRHRWETRELCQESR
jgi:N-acetylneuraminic acid mutarotase